MSNARQETSIPLWIAHVTESKDIDGITVNQAWIKDHLEINKANNIFYRVISLPYTTEYVPRTHLTQEDINSIEAIANNKHPDTCQECRENLNTRLTNVRRSMAQKNPPVAGATPDKRIIEDDFFVQPSVKWQEIAYQHWRTKKSGSILEKHLKQFNTTKQIIKLETTFGKPKVLKRSTSFSQLNRSTASTNPQPNKRRNSFDHFRTPSVATTGSTPSNGTPKPNAFRRFIQNYPVAWAFIKWFLLPAIVAAIIIASGGIAAVVGVSVGLTVAAFVVTTAAISVVGNGIHLASEAMVQHYHKSAAPQRDSTKASTAHAANAFGGAASLNNKEGKEAPSSSSTASSDPKPAATKSAAEKPAANSSSTAAPLPSPSPSPSPSV
jgi:hypothetical protein